MGWWKDLLLKSKLKNIKTEPFYYYQKFDDKMASIY
jgi:hypothetical protein